MLAEIVWGTVAAWAIEKAVLVLYALVMFRCSAAAGALWFTWFRRHLSSYDDNRKVTP